MPLKSRISKKSQLADDVYLTSEAQDSPVHTQRKNQRAHSEVRRCDPNQVGASHSAPMKREGLSWGRPFPYRDFCMEAKYAEGLHLRLNISPQRNRDPSPRRRSSPHNLDHHQWGRSLHQGSHHRHDYASQSPQRGSHHRYEDDSDGESCSRDY